MSNPDIKSGVPDPTREKSETCTLQQVIDGLREGRKFKHQIDDDGGWEYVEPTGNGMFQHAVAGASEGGYGGANEMSISDLEGPLGNRWEADGWVEDVK